MTLMCVVSVLMAILYGGFSVASERRIARIVYLIGCVCWVFTFTVNLTLLLVK